MYQYRIFDFFPGQDDPETWARGLAAEGWEFAVRGTGVLVEINGVARWRYYLRRRRSRRNGASGSPE